MCSKIEVVVVKEVVLTCGPVSREDGVNVQGCTGKVTPWCKGLL
jgi:hypothetical protein